MLKPAVAVAPPSPPAPVPEFAAKSPGNGSSAPLHIRDYLTAHSADGVGEVVEVQATSNGDKGEVVFEGPHEMLVRMPVHVDPRTGKRFAYGYLPVGFLTADPVVSPRGLSQSRVARLAQAFATGEPRLQHCVCRMEQGPGDGYVIYLFDGCHAAAAELLTGQTSLLCKVFLAGEMSAMEALHYNNHAHSELRQQEFRGRVLTKTRAPAFQNRWAEFLKDARFPFKSEQVFVEEFVSPLEGTSMRRNACFLSIRCFSRR